MVAGQVVVLCLSLVVLCFGAQSDRDLYHDFLVNFQKPYFKIGDRQEYDLRFEIFKDNLRLIERENAKNNGLTLGITEFADLTNEEFRARNKPTFVQAQSAFPKVVGGDFALPTTFNWSDKGVVGPVLNEGQCGSPYILTIVESISSIYAVNQSTKYALLSYQQVQKCTENGCNGGDAESILRYVEAYGLGFTFDNTCPTKKVTNGVCIEGNACSQSGNETALAYALISQGPLYIGVDGSLPSFQLYLSGIYAPSDCNPNQLDTTLLLVGYTEDAWYCQNHWGTGWGLQGYISIARNKRNVCGVATEACYPTGVAKC
jgi:hypothetical protein